MTTRSEGEETVYEPKTVAEHLDAAQNGEEFGIVVKALFRALGELRDEEEGRSQ